MLNYKKIKELSKEDSCLEYIAIMSLFGRYDFINEDDVIGNAKYCDHARGNHLFVKKLLKDLESLGYIERLG